MGNKVYVSEGKKNGEKDDGTQRSEGMRRRTHPNQKNKTPA